MEKVGIVTVYYTENVGSVLQAYALKNFLTISGYDVYFIDTKNKFSAHSKISLLKKILRSIKTHSDFRQCISRYNYFDKFIKNNFSVIDPNDVERLEIKKLVIGSDTVWDIDSRYFIASEDLFWGTRWDKISIISYAASIANSSINKLLQQKYRSEAIKKIKAVGVRDSYSKQFVESILKKNIPVNCDPTMLFDISYYQKQCKSIPERYILLYLFEELEPSFRKKLKQYTATHNLKIICLGKHITGSDIWISSTIENFLSYFNSAEFVVTNTFHGTVFSIIFNKNFAVLDYNKIKVREVLTKFGLESRLTKYDLRILEQKIDYTKVNHILHSFQKESQNYLLQSLSS